MNNLTAHMSELRRILANIENKNLNETTRSETVELFAKRLFGKTGKELVKELGPRVEINVVIKRPKVDINTKKPTGEFTEREVKEVWEHMPGTELYAIKTVNGIEPKQIRTRTADVIKTEVETAAKEGRIAVSTSENVGKNVGKPAEPGLDPVADATAKAERLSIAELEKKIASKEGTALEQKAFADELAKKKAGAPPAEVPKDKFDNSAEIARKKAQSMKIEELEAALKNKDIPAVTRKEYEKELATKLKNDPEVFDVITGRVMRKSERDARNKKSSTDPATGGEVLVKKEIEREKAAAKTALDDGTVKIKDENLLPKKPNETPTDQLERTLKDDPAYKGAWEGIEGTEKEVGFWKRLGRKAKVGGLISIPVLLAAGGAYVGIKRDELPEPEEEILNDPTTEVDDAEIAAAEEAAKKAEEAAKKAKEKEKAPATDVKGPEGKTDAEKNAEQNAEKNQAPNVTSTDPNAVANTPTAEQAAELAKLKAQIDALVAELAKSKDPTIQKRLAAVRAKLGQASQAPSVASTEKGGWKNIGNNYRRWYGPDGYDEEGSFNKRGDLDTIPYDAGQVDKWSKMSNQEKDAYLRKAERAGKLK
jgi:hypothetical protein